VVGGGGEGGGGGGQGCVDQKITVTKEIPNVALLIDQSGSMDTNLASGGSRWTGLRDVLTDPDTGLIHELQSDVRFGLALYTGVDTGPNPVCPRLTEVAFGLDNYQAISDAYASADPIDDTPTGESLALIAGELAVYTKPGAKAIVLATDGEPDSCADPDANDPNATRQLVVDAAQAAFEQGIRTYVIFVGNAGDTAPHLRQVANVGQGFPADDPTVRYAEVNDTSAVRDAFLSIINGVRSCKLTLNGHVQAGYVDKGTVTLDGDKLTQDDPDGWKLVGDNAVELLGSSCELIKSGSHDLQVQFPCEGIIIIR